MFLVVLPLGVDYPQNFHPADSILAYMARPYLIKIGEASEGVELQNYGYRRSENWQWNVPYGGVVVGYLVHNCRESTLGDGRGLFDGGALRRCPSYYSFQQPRHTL